MVPGESRGFPERLHSVRWMEQSELGEEGQSTWTIWTMRMEEESGEEDIARFQGHLECQRRACSLFCR